MKPNYLSFSVPSDGPRHSEQQVPGSTPGVRMLGLCVTLLVLLPACDLAGPDETNTPEYVVESYQIAGQTLKPVYLSRTATLEGTYDFSDLAVSGAQVHIERLSENGEVQSTHPYREGDSAGVYVPLDSARVEPLAHYRLTAEITDENHEISAQTVVPDTFSVLSTTSDSLVYQGDQQLFVNMTRSTYPERQEVFQFTSRAADPRPSRMTPFYRDVAGSDSAETVAEYRLTSSPLINGSNYVDEGDATISVRVPWLMFAFYGTNHISSHAVDENLYDFLRSQAVQQGGGTTIGPGEIPSVLEHVDGGTGVFGSYAEVNADVYVARRGE